MTEREALLRAVCENPDDDTPRLVFADWLQENGDESDQTRAEFIRAQVELARGPNDALAYRVAEMYGQFATAWLSALPVPDRKMIRWAPVTWVGGEEFDRGFPQQLLVQTAGVLLKHANVLFAATSVRRLMIWNIKRADKLAQLPQLRHLHTFRVRILSKRAADELVECPYLDSVPDVRLSFTALTPEARARLRERFGDRIQHQP